MRSLGWTPAALLAAALVGSGCARNNPDNEVGAARDTSATVASDSVPNQSQSGVTDSSGQSTLGTGVEKTRPDQGQPVTSKGDTINPGVDSSAAGSMSSDSSGMNGMTMDSSSTNSSTMDSSSTNSSTTDSSTTRQ
jgi:hypothetical protein